MRMNKDDDWTTIHPLSLSVGGVLATATQLPASIRTFINAINRFREMPPQAYRFETTGETMGLRLSSQNAQRKT